jgi:hypothetical protein
MRSAVLSSPALQPARHARSSQLKFWQSIGKRLRKQDLEKVDEVIQCYDVDQSIAGLERLVGEYLPAAENEKDRLYKRRKIGGKVVSTEIQQFAKTFADFLGCYSQIVDIMNQVDTQFGGVAVQTLSLLLIVSYQPFIFQQARVDIQCFGGGQQTEEGRYYRGVVSQVEAQFSAPSRPPQHLPNSKDARANCTSIPRCP